MSSTSLPLSAKTDHRLQSSCLGSAFGKSMLAVLKHFLLLDPWKDNFSSIRSVIVPGE